MKKLFVLFSVLAFFSLILVGCQKSEDINGPGELTKPDPVVWEDPDAGSSIYEVDLVQGQFDDVGSVTVEKDGSTLIVTYTIDEDRDCEISEVHVDLAKGFAGPPFSIDFHVNSQGNPSFGLFDSKNLHEGDVVGLGTSEVVVTFDEECLLAALGIDDLDDLTKIYVAAHAVVCCDGGDVKEYFCPDAQSAILDYTMSTSPNYIFLRFKTPVIDGETEFEGWCLDAKRTLGQSDIGEEFNFLCSYDLGEFTCVVDFPENLDLANWIINNKKFNGTEFTKYQIQGALWHLLSNSTFWYTEEPDYYASDYMAVVNAALANGEGFVPTECGQKVLIIGFNQNPDTDVFDCANITRQVIALEADVECEQTCETAMGFPSLENTEYSQVTYSALFPGSKWFRYIAFNL